MFRSFGGRNVEETIGETVFETQSMVVVQFFSNSYTLAPHTQYLIREGIYLEEKIR